MQSSTMGAQMADDTTIPLPLAEIEAFVAETRDLVEKVTFDESGIAGRGGNGGLLSRETIRAADELRQRLASVAAMVAAHQEGK